MQAIVKTRRGEATSSQERIKSPSRLQGLAQLQLVRNLEHNHSFRPGHPNKLPNVCFSEISGTLMLKDDV